MDFESNTPIKRRKLAPSLSVTDGNTDISYMEFEQNFVEGYLLKLCGSSLDKSSYLQVLSILEEFDQNTGDISELYNRITDILIQQDDLITELLLFLYPQQALACGKMMEFLQLYQMKEFLFKLHLYFKKCPVQIRKVMDSLNQLIVEPNISSDTIRNTVLPLLKNNIALIDSFVQLLPTDKPPESLFAENWENIDIYNDDCNSEETMIIPKLELEDSAYISNDDKEKNLYCTFRNINFINGRLYIQTEKILRPAKLIFEGENGMALKRRLMGKENTVPVKCTKIQKKTETTNNDSTFTESEEESCDSNLRHRKKRKTKLSSCLFKKHKSPCKCKSKSLIQSSENTDETEISDDGNIGECNNTQKPKSTESGAVCSDILDHITVKTMIQEENPLLKRPNLNNLELILTSSDTHYLPE